MICIFSYELKRIIIALILFIWIEMDFKKFRSFSLIEMDSIDQNFDTNKINPFLSFSFHFRLLESNLFFL